MATTIRELLARVGFSLDRGSQAAVESSLSQTRGALTAVATAAAEANTALVGAGASLSGWIRGALGLAAIKVGLVDYVAEAEQARKASEALGIQTATFQTWAYAAKSVQVEGEQLQALLGKLGAKALEAAKGGGELGPVLKLLGITETGAALKAIPLEQLLTRVADGFARVPPGAERTRAAMKLFEEAGPKLLPLLSQGSEGLGKLRAQLQQSGVILSGPALAAAQRYSAGLKQIKLLLTGARNAIMGELLPSLAAAISRFTAWLRVGERIPILLHLLKVAAMAAAGGLAYLAAAGLVGKLQALAAALRLVALNFFAIGGLGAKLMLAAPILAAVAAFLLLEDAIRLVRGEGNVLGDYLSPATVAQVSLVFRGLWAVLTDLGRALGPALREALAAFGPALGLVWSALRPFLPWLAKILKWAATILAAFIWGAAMLLRGLVAAFAYLVRGVRAALEAIVGALRAAWAWISDIIGAYADLFRDLARVAWQELGKAFRWLGRNIATPALEAIRAGYDRIAAAAKRALDLMIEVRDFFRGPQARGIGLQQLIREQGGTGITVGNTTLAAPQPVPTGPHVPEQLTPIGPPTSRGPVTNNVGGISVSVVAPSADPEDLAARVAAQAKRAVQDVLDQAAGDFYELET